MNSKHEQNKLSAPTCGSCSNTIRLKKYPDTVACTVTLEAKHIHHAADCAHYEARPATPRTR